MKELKKDQIYDFCKDFLETVPIEELYTEIRKRTGLDDLKFTKRIKESSHENPYIIIESQDIADKIGFMKLIMKELYICTFSSRTEVKHAIDDNNNIVYYDSASIWGTINFNYKHPGGGSNGYSFLYYEYSPEEGWKFENDYC